MRERLLVNSRPIYPLTRPRVVWNGQNGALGAGLGNSSSQSGTQVGQGMANATLFSGIGNATEGQALVA